ncbi:MAG: hypothetical protein R2837_11355 [Aliarcobacter sp.]
MEKEIKDKIYKDIFEVILSNSQLQLDKEYFYKVIDVCFEVKEKIKVLY